MTAAPVDESKLRRVSLSTNALLFTSNPSSGSFDTNARVLDLLKAMRNKYRLFLITQVSNEGSLDHETAKAQLQELVDAGAVKAHRVLFCSTADGKKSLIRQLGAELHIETDAVLVEGLQRFMNKFHLIKTPANKEDVTRVAKQYADKVVSFRSADAYAAKLLPSLQTSAS